MVDEELVRILVCPETKQPLRILDSDTLKKVNDAVHRGELMNRAGKPVEREMPSALIREDGSFIYPIWDDIPVMLVEESFSLPLS